MTEIYSTIARAIIKQQELIIGPIAWSVAKKVEGLKIQDSDVTIKGDGKVVIEKLVKQYEGLFGQASIEVCKDALHRLKYSVNNKDIPSVLV